MRLTRNNEKTEKREKLFTLQVQKIYLTKLQETFPKYREEIATQIQKYSETKPNRKYHVCYSSTSHLQEKEH